jgi:uncharacterized protein YqjF (DUF2071 family)
MSVMMASAPAPPLPGRTLFDQRWQNLTFLHWPVDPAQIAHLFPPGTRPDTRGGVTYVGLVPFHMRGAGIGPITVPYLGDFLETNVRLYSVDDAGHHGVVFRTLDAQRLLTVLLARYGFGVPYTWAKMTIERRNNAIDYRTHRRWPRPRSTSAVTVEVGDTTDPTDTELWFTARWGLHNRYAGRTWWTPNRHEPWSLHEATLISLDDQLVAATGIAVDHHTMMRPLWSPGVHTQFGRPSRVG